MFLNAKILAQLHMIQNLQKKALLCTFSSFVKYRHIHIDHTGLYINHTNIMDLSYKK